MSNQTDPLPPLPNHESPVKIDDKKGTNQLGMSWRRWFELVREKLNVLNASLVGLASVTTVGFLSKKTDGSWGSRTWQNTSDINVTNPDGDSGNPSAVLTATGVIPGTYGDDSNAVVIEVDSKGRIISITTEVISGGGGGGGGDGWDTKMLASDEIRNNTTVSADVTGLTVTLASGKKYALHFKAQITNTNATPDLKLGITFAGTLNKVNGFRYGQSPGGALATAVDTSLLPVTTAFTTTSIGAWWLDWTYFLDVNTGGILKVQMAQNTAHASDVTMLAGAYMRIRDTSV